MELTCNRCHQTVEEGASFCPSCGLPQLVYSVESATDAGQPAHWSEAACDASSVAWRPAIRAALALGVPAGMLCSFLSPVGIFGLLLMALAGMWVVSLYMRAQRPAWTTLGAGARIGLVTGIVGGWTAAATTGLTLFAMRFWLHQGQVFDGFWETLVNQQMAQKWAETGIDVATIGQVKTMMLSPEGRSAWILCVLGFLVSALLVFATVGGAVGARLQIRKRRPEV